MINNISEAIPAAQAGDQEGLNYIYYNTYKDQYMRVYGNISNIEMAEQDKEKFIQDILKEAYEFIFANIKYVTNINQFDGWLVNVIDDIAARKIAELKAEDDKSAAGGVIVGASAGAGAAVGGSAAGNVLNANAATAMNTGAVGSQAGEMAGNAVGTATGKAMAGNGVAGSMTEAGVGKVAAGAGKAAGVGKAVAAAGATGAAKGGIVGTIGFKIVCGVIAVGVAGGAVTGVIVNHNDKKNDNKIGTTTEVTSENTTEVASSETTEVTTEETTEVTTEAAYAPVADDEWADILKGGLTKPEFEYMLCNVAGKGGKDGDITGITHDDITLLYLTYGDRGNNSKCGLRAIRVDGSGDTEYYVYNLNEVNDYVSVLTDDIFNADNCNDGFVAKVNGNEISIYTGVSSGDDSDVEILDSRYRSGDTMYVEFKYSYVTYADSPDNNYDTVKTAVLNPKEDGKYQVSEILAGSIKDNFGNQFDDNGGADDSQNQTTDNAKGNQSDMFIKTLKSIDTTQFIDEKHGSVCPVKEVTYQLYDVDGDGNDDLIINKAIDDGQPIIQYGEDVYINKGTKLVKAKNELGWQMGTFVYTETGIYRSAYGRFNGEHEVYLVNYHLGTLTESVYANLTADDIKNMGGEYTGWGKVYDVPEYEIDDYSPFD